MIAYNWGCMDCSESGQTEPTKTGIDDASRHTVKTGHSTMTACVKVPTVVKP